MSKAVAAKLAKNILLPIAIIYLWLVGYGYLSAVLGGATWPLSDMYMIEKTNRFTYVLQYQGLEWVLLTLVYYSVFFIINSAHRYWIALLPIVLFYVMYDAYFMSFGGVFKIDDISELPELVDVLAVGELIAYLAVFGLVVWAIISHITPQKKRRFIALLLPAIGLVLVNFIPSAYVNIFTHASRLGVIEWSDRDTAQNGYFASTLYFEAMMHQGKLLLEKIEPQGMLYAQQQNALAQWLQKEGNRRNVHIIVLESFFNPSLFKKIQYNKTPYNVNFANLIGGQETTIISPVFGGHTSQAEFEVLCGVPALHRYSAIEFNSFTGEPSPCLPRILKEAGYRVIASNGYKPSFFNAVHAYKGIGFDEIYFPKDYAPKRETYLKLVDDQKYIFDGDLLEQNLDFLKQHFEGKNPQPILNYVLGVYGHLEYVLDAKRHPIVIQPVSAKTNFPDNVVRAFNQIYYRTEILATYINELKKIDPNSLIILTADHLPRLSGKEFYEKMHYRNNEKDSIQKPSAFFVMDGRVKKQKELHQYELQQVILNYLSKDQYCKIYNCERSPELLSNQYDWVMSQAVR